MAEEAHGDMVLLERGADHDRLPSRVAKLEVLLVIDDPRIAAGRGIGDKARMRVPLGDCEARIECGVIQARRHQADAAARAPDDMAAREHQPVLVAAFRRPLAHLGIKRELPTWRDHDIVHGLRREQDIGPLGGVIAQGHIEGPQRGDVEDVPPVGQMQARVGRSGPPWDGRPPEGDVYVERGQCGHRRR